MATPVEWTWVEVETYHLRWVVADKTIKVETNIDEVFLINYIN